MKTTRNKKYGVFYKDQNVVRGPYAGFVANSKKSEEIQWLLKDVKETLKRKAFVGELVVKV